MSQHFHTGRQASSQAGGQAGNRRAVRQELIIIFEIQLFCKIDPTIKGYF